MVLEGAETRMTYDEGGAEPGISEGIFVLKNPTDSDRIVALEKLELIHDGSVQDIPTFFVYQVPDYTELTRQRIRVARGREVKMMISFPAIPILPKWGRKYLVRLHIKVNGATQTADSPVHIVKRMPR